jgi:predicted transcriptional regulator
MSNWVKLSRKLATSAIAAKPEYLAVWVHLLMAASYKEGEILVGRQVVRLLPGQLVFGRHKFSEKTGVSENIVRSALKVLEKLQQITIKSESKFSIITITKWDHYQTETPAKNQQVTSSAPATHHNKEVQEIQEEDQKHMSPDGADDGVPDSPERKPRKADETPYAEIMSAYQEVCGGVFKGAEVLSTKRKTHIRKCYELKVRNGFPFRDRGIEFWKTYFAECKKNAHWRGENDRGWKADLEFVTREENVLRVLGV